MADSEVLEEMGLSPLEARLYLVLLEAGQSKSGDIIKKSKLQSSTVYHTLGSLAEKGLVSYILRGEIKHFQAEAPEAFLGFLEDKRRKFEEALPGIKKMQNAGIRIKSARVFEGLNGLKSAFADVLATMKKGEEYYFFQVSPEYLNDRRVALFFRNYHLKRSGRGIRVKGLSIIGAKERMRYIYDLPHTQVRYLKEFLPTGLVIYKDKVTTLDWDSEPAAFQIQSRKVAESYRKFFEEKWKIAKP